MENIQYLSLDIMNNHILEYAYSKQYDEGRTLIFTVTENGLPYDLTDVIATFQMKKPDNTVILDNCIIEDNKIKINVTPQMTILQGRIPYQIQLLKDGIIITTVTGFFKIDKSVVDPDDVISSNEFNALNDALKKVNADYTYVMESAQAIADAAKESQIASKISEENAKISEENASISSSNASGHAKDAKTYSESANRANQAAMESSNNATYQATQASNYAKESQSYAIGGTETRDNEDIDNSKYYYEQAKAISESFSGALRPMGTVTFANLPTVSDASEGDMYNISDQFTTTSDFKEGSGLVIPAGSNVYKTAEGKWDILAGTPVTGIKGNAENSYRKGNVNITKANIGLGNVNNTADADKEVKYAVSAGSSTKATQDGNGNNISNTYLKKNDLLNLVYPVGAIYMSVNSVNPGTLFGGTWAAWGTGRVPVGVNTNDTNFNTVEKTGGSSSVSITKDNLPSHEHTVGAHNHGVGTLYASTNGEHTHAITTTINSGGGHTHKIKIENATLGSGTKFARVSSTSSTYTSSTATDSTGAHTHSATSTAANGGGHGHNITGSTANSTAFNTGATGGGTSINNLQPYITCYMWKRTA